LERLSERVPFEPDDASGVTRLTVLSDRPDRGIGAVAGDQRVQPVTPATFATRARDQQHRRAGGDLARGAALGSAGLPTLAGAPPSFVGRR